MELPIDRDVTAYSWDTISDLSERGEDQYVEFKRTLHAKDGSSSVEWQRSLEREINAFANANGGIIIFGVEDDGSISPFSPPDHEVEQSVTRLVQNSKPVPDLEISKPLSHPTADTDRIVLAVKISEAVRKPVLTSDSAVYRRINDRKEPMSREQMESLFVDHDRRQQALRQLEMEINRFSVAVDDLRVHKESPPDFHQLNTDSLLEVIRENTHLYSNEEMRGILDRIFERIRDIEDREIYVGRAMKGYAERYGRSDQQFNIDHRRELEKECKRLRERLGDLAEAANLNVDIN